MNKKNIGTIITVILLCLVFVCMLTACNKEKAVSSIQIIQGSFKEIYALDEKLNLSASKILVTYTDGSTASISITEGMVSGFDTSTTTTGRTLSVTYKGKSANYIYKVQSSLSVETSFRFNIGVVENESKTGYDVDIKADKASTVSGGVYALRFTLSTSGGIVLSEPTLKLTSAFKMEIYSVSVSSMVVVVYSESGYDCINDGDTILNVKATKPSSSGTISVQSGSISNGESDFVVPQSSYSIGE